MAEALVKAVLRGDEEAVRRLLEEGADPSAVTKKGLSALHVAAREGDPLVLAAILESPAIFINSPDRDNGYTALLHAISGCRGEQSIVRQILSVNGCDPKATDKEKNNGLHLAATMGQTEVVSLLLNRGVPREATNAYGDTPLHLALKEGNEETALLLLQRGANPNAKDAAGATPLHIAVGNRLLSAAVQIINSKKFDPDECRDAEGNTPMHVAAEEGLSTLMQQLQEAGFSLDTPNLAGLTPAAITERRKHQMEEEESKRRAALQERGERKRQQAAAAMQQTEVTAFCVAADLSHAVQETFYRKRFIYVDEAFLTLDETDLRKIGLNATERLAFKEAVENRRKEEIRQRELEEEEQRVAAAKQTRRLRIAAFIVVLAAFVLLYIGLQLVVLRQQR